jgi:tetratricopeptide (TPR) repeat protein
MKPARQMEKTLRKKLRFTAGATLHDQLLADVLHAQEESTLTKPALREPVARRIIMKSTITRLLSAAAVIAVAVLSMALWVKLSTPAYAISQTFEALQNVRFLHITRHDEAGRLIDERWIEIDPNGWQARYRQDAPLALLKQWMNRNATLGPDDDPSLVRMAVEDGVSTALYRYDKNVVILHDRKEMQFQWVGRLGRAFENLLQEGKILKENDEYQGRPAHKVWWPALHDECYIDPQTKLPLIVGDSELSYEEPPAGTFDIITPEGYPVIDRRPGAAGLLPDWFLQEEAVRENGHNYFGLGREALVSGNYAEAAAQFENVVAQGPGRNWAWFWLGSAYYGQGRYDLAVEKFSKVLEMSRKGPCSYCNYARGLAYARLGQLEEARADWLVCLPMMIRTLRIPSAGYMFEYADSPLVSCGEYQPSEPQMVVKMINRLRLISGQNFGYDPNGTPEQNEAALAAWEQWFNDGGQIQYTPDAEFLPIPGPTPQTR